MGRSPDLRMCTRCRLSRSRLRGTFDDVNVRGIDRSSLNGDVVTGPLSVYSSGGCDGLSPSSLFIRGFLSAGHPIASRSYIDGEEISIWQDRRDGHLIRIPCFMSRYTTYRSNLGIKNLYEYYALDDEPSETKYAKNQQLGKRIF